ncbi:MAG TPA: TetR family transcriptional regulator [Thermoleophilaceae bacterium]|nr:TetR family transcriptional regulator [Thermoleophilaceae bacterium]
MSPTPSPATPSSARARGAGEPRGATRRRELLEAAVRVIGRGGIAAVDHRAVAAEAGVPLGSTTYYFESKHDMVAQALNYVADREAERLRTEAERSLRDVGPEALPTRLADVLIHAWAGDRTVLLAQYELYLESARRADLRPAAERWDSAYRELLQHALEQLGTPDPGHRARLLCAGLDGLLLDHVATGSDPGDLRALVIELIQRIAAP